jgi:hypothetical protein
MATSFLAPESWVNYLVCSAAAPRMELYDRHAGWVLARMRPRPAHAAG